MKKETALGTIRIKVKDLQPYEKTKRSWKRVKKDISGIKKVIKLFKANKNFKILKDTKNPHFLKGQLGPEGQVQGARIKVLPNGAELDKAFSLFSEDLTIHDQDSSSHWDLIYKNKGGTYAYCYTLEKNKIKKKEKFNKVAKFDKKYSLLLKNVKKALKDNEDRLALPMFTLLQTHMRVGNEMYYKAHRHKGLTTLKKKDVTIRGDEVKFDYIAKDGVPRLIVKKFPKVYVNRLRKELRKKKPSDFVFTGKESKRPIKEPEFKKAFKRYSGEEFYPHIVRSHYATKEVNNFLKGKRKVKKEEVNALYLSIAKDLGHKRFIKKKQEWNNNFTVTVNHYIDPVLVEKVSKKIV